MNEGSPRVRVIRSGQFRRMRWKNGGGETVEIAIWPEGATLDNFDWRISMARVESDGPFSKFSGCDRSLVILHGNGMALTIGSQAAIEATILSPPLCFDAAAATSARLLDGPIVDLNVMTRRGRHSQRLRRVALPPDAEVRTSALHTHLLAWDGDIAIQTSDAQFALKSGDALRIDDVRMTLRLSLGQGAVGYLVEVFKPRAENLNSSAASGDWMVEPDGIEPTTSSMPLKRSPN